MPLNLSAITPGPGGTTMLGEGGGIEAAARRGRERKKREREAQENQVIDDSMPGNTLTSDPNKVEGNRTGQKNNMDSKTKTGSTDNKTLPVDKSSSQDKSPRQGAREGRWVRFKKYFQ